MLEPARIPADLLGNLIVQMADSRCAELDVLRPVTGAAQTAVPAPESAE
jgi:hypothetical protein